MANLFDTILSSLPANTGDALGAAFGDSPDASFKGLSAILPLLLSSFAGKAASGGDLGGLLSSITGALSQGNPLDNPAALLSGGAPATGLGALASQLLGSNLGPVSSTVAQLFGLKGSTVNSLLTLAGPLLAGGIGKVLGPTPTVAGVRNLLLSEKDSYAAALPPELRRLIGPAPAAATPHVVEEEKAGSGWWKWLLLGLGLLGLLWWLFGRGTKEEVVTPEPVAVEAAPIEPVAAPTGAGVVTEDRAGRPALVVFFDVGRSDVTNDLAPASSTVKSYVDSHPDARISVSGFNDPTGDAAANEALSKSRAEQVKAALVAAGFAADRIDLDKPAASTDTSDSYAAARRVEVTIKE
ncbi:OmpA family protein [Sandaracinobacter sp. RS1-74]|uniref:OmpA family protein n=1 Tax=Sandaracinobacteroides sayramensis TaxID=2913411 RepID=UPI001EDC86C2|nr:OmpA family protein [Sandaracinobacteroides sayramensis]MCG2842817.1 OmpA family protein [Sandaracinobacteroides sayramensis]